MQDFVLPHDPRWSDLYRAEATAIRAALPEIEIALHHIGSTAIPGIRAKPVIDMLGEVAELRALEDRNGALMALGYEALGAHGIAGRRYFLKADGAGRRTHHLHVYAVGDPHVARHIAFRDYLRQHPGRAAEYDRLKARLTRGGVSSREAYQSGKAPFIVRIEAEALAWSRRE